MIPFSVWAPRADQVELLLGGDRVPMTRGHRGWWSAAVPGRHPMDYEFVLDDGEPLPDPRSRRQPSGPHGPSRTFDVTAVPWTDEGWAPPDLATGVVYELHIGTFTPEGTFDAAITRLPHLADLGVTHVEIMPIADFPGRRGWGYDGVGKYAVHEAYGGPAGFARFVDAAHRHGLAVILDVVFNHLGPDGNYLGRFGPYFIPGVRTPWGDAINFDGADSDQVRDFMIGAAVQWLRDYRVDGLRLDAIHAMRDNSAIPFVAELAAVVRRLEYELDRRLVLIAEDDRNDPRVVGDLDRGGWGIAAQWADEFHHALHVALTGERNGYYADFSGLTDLATAINRPFVYDGRYSPSRRKVVGASSRGLPPSRFVVCLQNHDQVGNRARGERISHLVSPQLARVGAAFVLLSPSIPLIFQGEEWAASSPFRYFTDHQDPALGTMVSRGRREEFAAFGWDPADVPDPQDPATFTASKLDWSDLTAEPHASTLSWYRSLLALRHTTPDLADGPATARTDPEAGWLVMDRRSVRVAANFSDRTCRVPLDRPGRAILATTDVDVDGACIALPAESVAILTG